MKPMQPNVNHEDLVAADAVLDALERKLRWNKSQRGGVGAQQLETAISVFTRLTRTAKQALQECACGHSNHRHNKQVDYGVFVYQAACRDCPLCLKFNPGQ
jgi:hypothetical protein